MTYHISTTPPHIRGTKKNKNTSTIFSINQRNKRGQPKGAQTTPPLANSNIENTNTKPGKRKEATDHHPPTLARQNQN